MSRVTDEQIEEARSLLSEWNEAGWDREQLARFTDLAPALLDELERRRKELPEGLWTCPGCAFTFDAQHSDDLGGHSCPNCAEQALHQRVRELEEAVNQADIIAGDILYDYRTNFIRKVGAMRLKRMRDLFRAALPTDPEEKP